MGEEGVGNGASGVEPCFLDIEESGANVLERDGSVELAEWLVAAGVGVQSFSSTTRKSGGEEDAEGSSASARRRKD